MQPPARRDSRLTGRPNERTSQLRKEETASRELGEMNRRIPERLSHLSQMVPCRQLTSDDDSLRLSENSLLVFLRQNHLLKGRMTLHTNFADVHNDDFMDVQKVTPPYFVASCGADSGIPDG